MVGDHVISAFVDECLALAIEETIGFAASCSESVLIPGHGIGEELRSKRRILSGRMVQLRSRCFHQFAELRIFKYENSLGDEAKPALEAIAHPGQHLRCGDFGFGTGGIFGLSCRGRTAFHAEPLSCEYVILGTDSIPR